MRPENCGKGLCVLARGASSGPGSPRSICTKPFSALSSAASRSTSCANLFTVRCPGQQKHRVSLRHEPSVLATLQRSLATSSASVDCLQPIDLVTLRFIRPAQLRTHTHTHRHGHTYTNRYIQREEYIDTQTHTDRSVHTLRHTHPLSERRRDVRSKAAGLGDATCVARPCVCVCVCA